MPNETSTADLINAIHTQQSLHDGQPIPEPIQTTFSRLKEKIDLLKSDIANTQPTQTK